MADQWRYRGRTIDAEDVAFIRDLIARHSDLSRRKLSVKLCEAWQWRQAHGALRDMVCRGLLLMLHRAGAIELPAVRWVNPNPFVRRHWSALTLFLRQRRAPLDNTIVERALKKAILHRENALYFKTENGAHVGDLFMSLIHACEWNGVASLGYLIALQKHARKVAEHPAAGMPWNYRDTLAQAEQSSVSL